MKYNLDTLKQILKQDPNTPIIYFWGHTPDVDKITTSCFSQWYDCHFEVDGVTYHTTEQYMMAQKAVLFNDREILDQIMATTKPRDYKRLGRMIRNFNNDVWDANKYDIVVKGNQAKFSQNPRLKEFLLSTQNSILVEASRFDKIWGIGLDPEVARRSTINQWRGENILGCVLMDVRDWLKETY